MIAVKNLTKKYDKKQVVNNISLKIKPNEIVSLVGPSGCGKTTLLRLIAGFEEPDKGLILIDGVAASTPFQIIPPNERYLSMIFQDLALWPHMTVEEHIRFTIKNRTHSREELSFKIREIIQNVDLEGYNKRYPHQLSGGEKQRLAIARGVATEPRYLLMDEPFSNIDPILKDELGEFIVNLMSTLQMGIVYVTHNIEEISKLSDRIAVMENGALVQIGTQENIYEQPANGFVRKFLKM